MDDKPVLLRLLIHAVAEARINVADLEQVTKEHPNMYDSSCSGEIETAVKRVTGSKNCQIGPREARGHDLPAVIPADELVSGLRGVNVDRPCGRQ